MKTVRERRRFFVVILHEELVVDVVVVVVQLVSDLSMADCLLEPVARGKECTPDLTSVVYV